MDSELPPGAPSSINLPFVEDLYYEWLRDPTAVTPGWAAWFAALEPAPGAAPPPGPYAPRRDGAGAAACDDGFLARPGPRRPPRSTWWSATRPGCRPRP